MAKVPVQFTLNGAEKAEFIDSGTTLLNALRDKIGDTSPKGGCHQGTCGACSVIIDGELRLSCLTLAETCNGDGDHHDVGPRRKAASCIRCSAPSSTPSPRNAASARRA